MCVRKKEEKLIKTLTFINNFDLINFDKKVFSIPWSEYLNKLKMVQSIFQRNILKRMFMSFQSFSSPKQL